MVSIQATSPARRQITQFAKNKFTNLALGFAQAYQERKTRQFDLVKYTPEQLQNPKQRASTQEFIQQLEQNTPLAQAIKTQYKKSGSNLPLTAWVLAKLVEMPSRMALETTLDKFPDSKIPPKLWGGLTKGLKASDSDCGGGTGG